MSKPIRPEDLFQQIQALQDRLGVVERQLTSATDRTGDLTGTLSALTIADAAVTDAKLGLRAAARIRRDSATGVVNTGFATVPMDAEDLDSASLHSGSNSYIQLNRAGIWLIQGAGAFASNGSGRRLTRIIQHNSSDVFQRVLVSAGARPNEAGDGTILPLSAWWDFAVNDRVYLQSYDVNAQLSWAGSWLSAIYIGKYA